VNNNGDGGDANPGDGVCETGAGNGICTLRAAIQEANAFAGTDTINFAISGSGLHTIAISTGLPHITQPLTINGYSQCGSLANTNPITSASNAVLNIQINGLSMLGGDCLTIVLGGDSSLIKGLDVINCPDDGIVIDGSANNLIQGNQVHGTRNPISSA